MCAARIYHGIRQVSFQGRDMRYSLALHFSHVFLDVAALLKRVFEFT